jgi:predicted DNA-binding protein
MGFSKKTTYRLPADLRQSMLESVAKEYGKKGKSRWIKEAIAELIAKDAALASVGLGEDYETHDASDVLVMDCAALEQLQTAMTTIRRQDPLFAGVQSAVIRAAIRMRLINAAT